jgi:alkylhydroperoxidase/carboxymuconolactone decarboxylase family protein YurZ
MKASTGGGLPVDLPSSPLGAVDPEFERMALETGTFTYGLPGTSVREKLLQVLAADVCRGSLGLAFRMHVTAAKMHGIPYGDLLALLRFVAPYSGYPAAADALDRLGSLGVELGFDTAAEVGEEKAPGESDPALRSSDEWMAGFLASRTGRSWSEERLSARERVVVAITTDVGMQSLGAPFRGHVQLARRLGLSDAEIRDAVRFTAELSGARAAAALAELDAALRAGA